VPFFENLWFALGEFGLHGKGGLGKVQGLFIVHGILHSQKKLRMQIS
jgi:hypothetical protein